MTTSTIPTASTTYKCIRTFATVTGYIYSKNDTIDYRTYKQLMISERTYFVALESI